MQPKHMTHLKILAHWNPLLNIELVRLFFASTELSKFKVLYCHCHTNNETDVSGKHNLMYVKRVQGVNLTFICLFCFFPQRHTVNICWLLYLFVQFYHKMRVVCVCVCVCVALAFAMCACVCVVPLVSRYSYSSLCVCVGACVCLCVCVCVCVF